MSRLLSHSGSDGSAARAYLQHLLLPLKGKEIHDISPHVGKVVEQAPALLCSDKPVELRFIMFFYYLKKPVFFRTLGITVVSPVFAEVQYDFSYSFNVFTHIRICLRHRPSFKAFSVLSCITALFNSSLHTHIIITCSILGGYAVDAEYVIHPVIYRKFSVPVSH